MIRAAALAALAIVLTGCNPNDLLIEDYKACTAAGMVPSMKVSERTQTRIVCEPPVEVCP